MDIVIVANFCGDFSDNDNCRFRYIAGILSKNHQAELITSDFFHTTKQPRPNKLHDKGYRITALHEPGYRKNISLKRFYSHWTWGRNVAKYLKRRRRPDAVYCAVPSLSAAAAAEKYCRKNGIRFIIDIQDLWPQAFRMALDIPIVSDILFSPFSILAKRIYAGADEIVAVSKGYADFAQKFNRKGCDAKSVYLGTDLDRFDEYLKQTCPEKDDGELWLGYGGSLSLSYDIPCVIDALDLLKQKNITPPKLIVLGDGVDEERYQSYAKEKNTDAVFFGRVPYGTLCCYLRSCDFVVNPIIGKSVATIINKHADYAACGRPVINTQASAEYRELIDTYRMGFNCAPSSSREMADKLLELIQNTELRKQMGDNARRCAKEKFDRKQTYKEIESLFDTADKPDESTDYQS